MGPDDDRTVVPLLQFVEVLPGAMPPAGRNPADGLTQVPVELASDSIFLAPTAGGEPRWSLWGEPEA
jgi:hypothetical protein